jgi:hypothetical protein
MHLHDLHIHEYIPETGPPGSQENIHEFSSRLDAWIVELEGHPLQNEFTGRIEQVRERIRKYGISRPPHLVIIGRK